MQSLTSKILTSGQIFDQDGRLNFALADFMDAQTGRPNSLADLNSINAHFPLKEMNARGVHALNERLVATFAQSHDWVSALKERTDILINVGMGLGNKAVDKSIQSLHDFLDMARDINKKNTLKKINEESMMR